MTTLREFMDRYPGDYDDLTDGLPADTYFVFLLIEESIRTSQYWLSLHESPAEAADYHINQEYAEDWKILDLVDLRSGETFDGELSVTWVPRQNRPIETQFSADAERWSDIVQFREALGGSDPSADETLDTVQKRLEERLKNPEAGDG